MSLKFSLIDILKWHSFPQKEFPSINWRQLYLKCTSCNSFFIVRRLCKSISFLYHHCVIISRPLKYVTNCTSFDLLLIYPTFLYFLIHLRSGSFVIFEKGGGPLKRFKSFCKELQFEHFEMPRNFDFRICSMVKSREPGQKRFKNSLKALVSRHHMPWGFGSPVLLHVLRVPLLLLVDDQ